MTEQAQQQILAEAIDWHLRLRDGGAADWEAFVLWLEADPARSAAYDEVARADAALGPEAFPPIAANDDSGRRRARPAAVRRGPPGPSRRRRLPAARLRRLALAQSARPDRYEVATAAGQRRDRAARRRQHRRR